MHQTTNERLPLLNIQFLRFAAAFATLLFHARPYLPESGSWAQNVMSAGFAGVDVFFVISGFIMWYTTSSETENPASFIKRRLARIFTGYWPYLTIAITLLAIFDPATLAGKDILRSVFLLPISINTRVLPVSWTLTHELLFYLLFFALLCMSRRLRANAVYGLILLIIAVNVCGVAQFGFYGAAFYEKTSPAFRLLVSPYTLEFLIGILICKLYFAGVNKCAGLAAAFGIFLLIAGGWYNHTLVNEQLGNGPLVINRVLIFGCAAALLVYAAVCFERRGFLLLPRVSQVLGGASYSLYLSHTMLLSLYGWLGLSMGERQGWEWVSLIILILAYSTAHYMFIEKPFYRTARRWLQAESHTAGIRQHTV